MHILSIHNLSVGFSHKDCLRNFSCSIHRGDRIALIGRNGAGKTLLIKTILGDFEPLSGHIKISDDVQINHVPQLIETYSQLSGGQRFNRMLSEKLSNNPDLLILDEPTNHLDQHNRQALMNMLCRFDGALLIATHDTELIRRCTNLLWHLGDGKVQIFSGNYDDFIAKIRQERKSIEQDIEATHTAQQKLHLSLMAEQQRAKRSKEFGKRASAKLKWDVSTSSFKTQRSEIARGKTAATLKNKRKELGEQLSNFRLPEEIIPKFYIQGGTNKNIAVEVRDGSVKYSNGNFVLRNINFTLNGNEKLAIVGRNGCGKSTLLKAICTDPALTRDGFWNVPPSTAIGYLDQHYANLNLQKSAEEHMQSIVPDWTYKQIRKHLNDFLFRKNEEVNLPVAGLSGGERARLSLSLIAAKTPTLLILDEATNNIDLETKNHIIQILKNFPGMLIIVSHDEDFLSSLGCENRLKTGKELNPDN